MANIHQALIILDPSMFARSRFDNRVNQWRGLPEEFMPRLHLSSKDYCQWIVKYAKRVCLVAEAGKIYQIDNMI